jgi:hypothetical protein
MASPPKTDQSGGRADSETPPATGDPASEGLQRRATSSDARDTPIEEVPAPPYSTTYGEMDLRQGGFGTSTRIAGIQVTIYALSIV